MHLIGGWLWRTTNIMPWTTKLLSFKFRVNSSDGSYLEAFPCGAERSINGPTHCSYECGWQWSRLCISLGLTNAVLHKHGGGADFYFQSYFCPNRRPVTYEPRAPCSALASFQLSSIHLPPGCESWAHLTRLCQYTSLFQPWRKPFSHADEKPQSKKTKQNNNHELECFSSFFWENLWLLPASNAVPF